MEVDAGRLKQQMQTVGLSNRALARAVKVNHSFINRMVSGEAKSCTPVLAAAIAEALLVHVNLLFAPKTSSGAAQLGEQSKPKSVAA